MKVNLRHRRQQDREPEVLPGPLRPPDALVALPGAVKLQPVHQAGHEGSPQVGRRLSKGQL